MIIEECLILGAGMGTRMGEIGKKLPKVLWPIFEMPLLELQVKFARDLGCKRIFTNTYFLHEQVQKFVDSKGWKDVITCHEPVLLDVGGGIQNVANKCQGERLLILNGDLFLFLLGSVRSNGVARRRLRNRLIGIARHVRLDRRQRWRSRALL